jgi:D-sedoheptulose 7-phosphate isomerase
MTESDQTQSEFARRAQLHFVELQELIAVSQRSLSIAIGRAGELLTHCLLHGGKVLACGNGGAAAATAHFAAEMVGRFERERPGLPAIALSVDPAILTALGNDYGFDVVFSRQVQALGAAGDVLLAMSTSGQSPNIIEAIDAAHDREMKVIALTGRDGGRIRARMQAGDVEICVAHARTLRIQELHLLALHAVCDCVDYSLLGG